MIQPRLAPSPTSARRRAGTLALLTCTFLPLAVASACATENPDSAGAAAEALLPGGYETVIDTGRSDPGHFEVTQEDTYLQVATGPGGIAWRPEDTVPSGNFLAEATMTVVGAPVGYREGFGVFVGGRDLKGRGTRYTYLLVRPSGEFLIKQRRGNETEVLVDWTPQTAVQKVTDDLPAPVNVLGIMTVGDEVRFLVNGTVVHRLPTEDVRPYGIAGLRVNHRVMVRVPSWYLGAPPLENAS